MAERSWFEGALERGTFERAEDDAGATIEGFLMEVGYTEVTFIEGDSL